LARREKIVKESQGEFGKKARPVNTERANSYKLITPRSQEGLVEGFPAELDHHQHQQHLSTWHHSR